MEDQDYKQKLAEYEKNKDKPHFHCKGSGKVPCCGKEKCRACRGSGVQKCLPCHGTGLQYPNLKKPDSPDSSAPQAQAYQPPRAQPTPPKVPFLIHFQLAPSFFFFGVELIFF